MRIFSAGLATETNTFAPMPTGMGDFVARGYFPAGQHPDRLMFFSAPLWAARIRGRPLGWELKEGLVAAAQPGGIVPRRVYESLRNQLLDDLRAALPVDVVLLGLHGAMVAEGYDDCEGDLLERARAIVGPNVVIGAELDPHHHLSARMLANTDLMIAFKEYPHTDALERALELVDLCVAKVRKKIHPVSSVCDCGMIVTLHTTRDPARGFVDRIQALEHLPGVLSISITHGFHWGDVADMGTKVLVYTDGDAVAGQTLACDLADELIRMREQLRVDLPGIDEAIDQAKGMVAPVILADGADNPGGGAAGDSTFVARRLLERGIRNVAIGPMWDPVAVGIAMDAGQGSTLPMRIGGKTGPMSGMPLDLECTVRAVGRDLMMSGLSGTPLTLGNCALVEAQGIEFVLTSKRNQAMGVDLFTQLGCELSTKQLIVLKSSQHFQAAFAQVSDRVIYVKAPGTVALDLNTLPFRKISRPKWPLCEPVEA
ncbi:MAG: M81 family metallopeptidase [Burkholderiaceae bacterium]|nr:M81 family metallopeptidase [Burkholderiaceae bacterium]